MKTASSFRNCRAYFCGETKFRPGRTNVIQNPLLIIEALSPSTERRDRGVSFTTSS